MRRLPRRQNRRYHGANVPAAARHEGFHRGPDVRQGARLFGEIPQQHLIWEQGAETTRSSHATAAVTVHDLFLGGLRDLGR